MSDETTFDVRVQGIDEYKGARGTTYTVRWVVAGKRCQNTFATKALATAEQAVLRSACGRGEAFDVETGRPAKERRQKAGPSWYAHAVATAAMKWDESSPNHRKGTAEGLTAVTVAMLVPGTIPPDCKKLRLALQQWAFVAGDDKGVPPADIVGVLAWAEKNSRPLRDLTDPRVMRKVIDRLSKRLDGKSASPSTYSRKRAALSIAVSYAIELGHLDVNPLKRVKTVRRVAAVTPIDSRCVVNHAQARSLFNAVDNIAPELTAYYACMYYAALRPGEARNLRADDIVLPKESSKKAWGELILSTSWQDSGSRWTDDGKPGEERALKHRADGATREVPVAPPLAKILRKHLKKFGTGADDWLFVARTPRGVAHATAQHPVRSERTNKVWRLARKEALTPKQEEGVLAKVPYDLRHACVSTWLAAGVAPTQVAQWAGHSVDVLLKVYAHAIDGHTHISQAKIDQILDL